MFRAATSDEHPAATVQPTAGNQRATLFNLVSQLGALTDAASAWAVLRRGFRLGCYALLACLVAVVLLVAAATVPVLFGYHTYVVKGGSMGESLKRGGAAVTSPTSPGALKVGDVIAWRSSPESPPVLHRIVKISEDDEQRRFITQGDENQAPDREAVTLEGAGDRVVYSVPYAGYILDFADSESVRLALIGVPLVLLIVLFLREGRQSEKAREREVDLDPADSSTGPAGPRATGALPGHVLPATIPDAGRFSTQADEGDLPAFLIRQLQGQTPFRPRSQSTTEGRTAGVAGPSEL